MSKSHISANLRQQVAEQSRDMCCYCQSQQRLIGINLTVEHIIPEYLIALFYCILAVSGLKQVGIRRWNNFPRSHVGTRKLIKIFLIGDPKQAIYSFRGADIFTYMTASLKQGGSVGS